MIGDKEARIFIGMGSNLGNGPETLRSAWEMLGGDQEVQLIGLSNPYVSAPVDMYSQHWFTNAVGEVRATLSPSQLLARMLEVEMVLGRVRDEQAFGFQDRTIDLDLLYYGDRIQDEPELVLPHPHLHERLFVLQPMVELAPDFMDPRRGQTVRQIHERLLAHMDKGLIKRQEISRLDWPQEGR